MASRCARAPNRESRATTQPEADERSHLLPQRRRHSGIAALLLRFSLGRGRKRATVGSKDGGQGKGEGDRAKKRNAHDGLRLLKAAGMDALRLKNALSRGPR